MPFVTAISILPPPVLMLHCKSSARESELLWMTVRNSALQQQTWSHMSRRSLDADVFQLDLAGAVLLNGQQGAIGPGRRCLGGPPPPQQRLAPQPLRCQDQCLQ